MLFGKKKKRIAFLLGCLWYYIKRMEDVNRFSEATDIITTVCVELGIDWEQVNNAEKAYQTWDAFQSGWHTALPEGRKRHSP